MDAIGFIRLHFRFLVIIAVCLFVAFVVGGYVAVGLQNARAEAVARELARNPRQTYPINRMKVQASINRARENGPALRQAMIDKVILKNVQVRRTGDDFLANYYGFRVRGVLDPGEGRCLVAYVQGHNGSPADFDYYLEIVRAAHVRGCDVLSFSLVGIGLNAGPVSFPAARLGQTVHLSASEAANHETYRLFQDELNPDAIPLSLFLSGHYAILREAIRGYEDVSIIGISGGGWATTMLAAIMPEIDRSISWAGSLPREYRLFGPDIGDFEQNVPFFDNFDYWTLYMMGEIDATGRSTRSVVLVYNDEDDCCFSNPAASAFQRDMLGFDWPHVIVVKSTSHVIEPELAEDLLFPHP